MLNKKNHKTYKEVNVSQPIDKESGRKVCTKEFPWKPENEGERWMHPEANFLYSEDAGDGGELDVYSCPICDQTLKCFVGQ
jgi:hypothetical protein